METQTVREVSIALEWSDAFSAYLAQTGRSSKTISAYVQDLKLFAEWLAVENQAPFAVAQVTSWDLRAYREFSFSSKVAPATWNRRRCALRVFCAWLVASGVLSYDPFQGVEAAEEQAPAPRWLEHKEFKRVLNQLEVEYNGAKSDYGKWQAARDQAMVALMAFAGLRVAELVALDLADVQLSDRSGRVTIRRGKGDKKRVVPLGLEARRALQIWLGRRGSPAGALFTSKSNGRLTTRSVERTVQHIGAAVGVKMSPHDLRHTFAKLLVDKGRPLTVAKMLLGHARLETTARYAMPGYRDLENAVEGL